MLEIKMKKTLIPWEVPQKPTGTAYAAYYEAHPGRRKICDYLGKKRPCILLGYFISFGIQWDG
jgi:hypothetical protein